MQAATLLLDLPSEIQEMLLVYCGFPLANTCRRLLAASSSSPVRTRMLLTSHNIVAPSAFPHLPPVPMGPYFLGPTEERYGCFLSDKTLTEEDALTVFRLRCANHVYVELACEMAVTKRWTNLWQALFPLPSPILSWTGSSDQIPQLLELGVALCGWTVSEAVNPVTLNQQDAWIQGMEAQCQLEADNALVQAAMFDRAELVSWLLQRGIYLHTTSTGKSNDLSSSSPKEITGNVFRLVTLQGLMTALILSAKHPASLSTLSILLAHPLSDVNTCDGSPLAWSCRTGNLDAVKLLLSHGADAAIRGGVAGLWAAEYGHTEIVKLLVKGGKMDIHTQEEYALRWAVARGQTETVTYLCQAGAAVDAMGGFALRHAVQMDFEEIVDVLLAYGADINVAGSMADARNGEDETGNPEAGDGNALVRWAMRLCNKSLEDKLRNALRSNEADYEGKWRSRLKQLRRESLNEKSKANHNENLEGSHKVVLLAMTSNFCMFSAKLYAAIVSGSASMFAEALHSLADLLNEMLLMIGIRRSLQEPDANHPYGFSSERTAWALVSSVGIFFLGGGVSMYHGINGLLSPHSIGDATIGFWVLGLSLCFEIVTLTYAFRQISRSAAASRMSFVTYLRRGSDPSSVQVFLEDCSSIVGIVIASTCLSLAKYLSLPFLDNVGSILIGILLASLSMFLVRRNIASLVERSMESNRRDEIVAIIEADPVVRSLHDVKTTQIGPDWVRFKAEVLFDGEEVARRYVDASWKDGYMGLEYEKVKAFGSEEEFRKWFVEHGGKVVAKLGTEVDRIELDLKAKAPEVKHCDLEIL
ncbi:hypothetical protein CcCBS67573_g00422 [Chytriomyces confervae]|uniref:Cation efflux protein transmembrane domain-containing protein n=1 Tax=Chytriomyces confervae TaxID=246404 RepID=A0A507FS85_9FUNG|nr:hypothetical protein CcCBS67573_g00422 [Chytriomyces confervae]